MFLIDTSVWIAVFNKKNALALSRLPEAESMCIAPPIYQEVLQGFRNDRDYLFAKHALDNAVMLENPLKLEVFAASAEMFRFLRKKGVTVRSGVDVLLAVIALRHGATVVHRDRDFTGIARYTNLEQREL